LRFFPRVLGVQIAGIIDFKVLTTIVLLEARQQQGVLGKARVARFSSILKHYIG